MPFDEKPQPGPQDAEQVAGEFRKRFAAPEQPASFPALKAVPPPSKPTGTAAPKTLHESTSAPGEFTQFFRQIPRPTSQPPDLDSTTPASYTSTPGEFTQFFSSSAAPSAPTTTPRPGPTLVTPSEVAPLRQLPEVDDRTQIVQPTGASLTTAASSPRPTFANTVSISSALPFADAPPSPAFSGDSFAALAEGTGTLAEAPHTAPGMPSASAPTEIFQALEHEPTVPVALPAPPARRPTAPPGPGEFTQLMEGLKGYPAQPMPAQPMFPVTPVSVQPSADIGIGPGELTRLMQNLGSPAAAVAPLGARHEAPTDFATSVAGESEFTRVVRGSSLRNSGLPSIPAVAASVAPAEIQHEKTAHAKTAAATKPWLPLLLVANAILLLILIALAILFLHPHH